jgi:DNA-directed RNA polymerase specialized sigma24 family protein
VDLFSQRKVWGLTQAAFEKLLGQLGADRERAGEQYEIIRRKLIKFFEWRGSVFPEDHADQVINRVARKIDEGEEIRDLKNYFYGVARLLFLETLKEQDKEAAALEHLPQARTDSEEPDESEPRFECLEMCLRGLTAENRELIVQYYRKERGAKIENRRAMAQGMGIQLNALRIRAHRIKTKIEECINDCLTAVGPEMK